MPRPVRNAKLDSRAARLRLPSSKEHGDAYWLPIELGVALGYWKPQGAKSGTSRVRRERKGVEAAKDSLGVADDHADADGLNVLDLARAQRNAIAWEREATERPTGRGFTVFDAFALWWSDCESRSRSPVAVSEQNGAAPNSTGHRRIAIGQA